MKHLKAKFINYSWLFFVIGVLVLIPSAYFIYATENFTRLSFIVFTVIAIVLIGIGFSLEGQYKRKRKLLEFVEPQLLCIEKFYFNYNEFTLTKDNQKLDELFLIADDRTTATSLIGIRCAEALDKLNYSSEALFEHWQEYPKEFQKFVESMDDVIANLKKPFTRCPATIFNIRF